MTIPSRHGRSIGTPDLTVLAHRALDAATAAGASYAEAHFTVTRTRAFSITDAPQQAMILAVGVRALTQGRWGFAADTNLTPDMIDWLGRTAAAMGKATAWANVPAIDLGPRPPVATGHWQTPVKRDPFSVSDEEVQGVIREIIDATSQLGSQAEIQCNFECQDQTFASTDGAFATQTIYTTFGTVPRAKASELRIQTQGKEYVAPFVSPCGMGFEACERIPALVPELVQRSKDLARAKPLARVGRFDVVLDGYAMAGLVNAMGLALEIDRALGNEANTITGGVSYLSPIDKKLGTTTFPTAMTITADRTMEGGAATVRWDDEGITPPDMPLIKNGTIVNYATSRAFAPELADWYHRQGQPVQSLGDAEAETALSFPMVQAPNLRLHPGSKGASVEELCARIDQGFVVHGGEIRSDQQLRNAFGGAKALVYEIRKGKIVGTVDGVRYQIPMPDLQKALVAFGGEESAETRGFTTEKGEPSQLAVRSVRAVAAHFQNVVVRQLAAPRSIDDLINGID